ncbi:MAG: epoxide hydrolase [Myxococcales bacterium]|nr:epoxide hydrolase [Myxococcales bacterium]
MADPFRIDIPESVLTDLKSRLRSARFAPDFANKEWAYGTETETLRELCAYWADDFDWRAQEAAMNEFSHFTTEIEDVPIHFIHERGKGPNPMPLILSHGWPWTFWDFNKVIRPLSDPASFGGDPADAFDVIVPSLPGFGFSSPLTVTGINFWRTADLWDQLMRDELGYSRYAAQGGDWGALVTNQLGHKYADHLFGIHVNLVVPLDVFIGEMPAPEFYEPDGRAALERTERFFLDGSGYSAIQATRPQTLAHALNDSPLGLCSWILEKRRAWSDSKGDVYSRFSKDELCTTMTIYWATETYGTSARYYYECVHNPWTPSSDAQPVVKAPTSAAIFPEEVVLLPKRWAEQYYNLKRWTPMKSGGHFAPMEEPEALVEDIRASFRAERSA